MSGGMVVSQTVYSILKRDLEKKRKNHAKLTAELKALEASFSKIEVVNLRPRRKKAK